MTGFATSSKMLPSASKHNAHMSALGLSGQSIWMSQLSWRVVTLALLLGPVCLAQNARFSAEQGPAVIVNGNQLANPWAGGLNSPQLSVCNLNNDVQADLFVFDRLGNKPLTFLGGRSGNGAFSFSYAPWYEQQLPSISSWAQMHDFDCDGVEDLFMSDPFGIRAFSCLGTNRSYSFSPVSPYLTTAGFAGAQVNLQVNYSDQPSITDMDGDGDLDVLAVTFGGSTLEHNLNISKDSTGNCGLRFRKNSACWGGHFLANTCGAFTFGACRTPAHDTVIMRQDDAQFRPMHQGTSIHLVELNGDNNIDLLMGDIGCSGLYALINQGTTAAPRFTSAMTSFPANTTPAQFLSFLAATTLDVDQDGDLDLIVIPNIDRNDNYLSDLKNSCWLYINNGSNQLPVYSLAQQNYLQNTMIDLGETAYPVFADSDGDGDQDLFVGHAATRIGTNYSSSIWYFENTGTATSASFALRNTDWLGLSSTGHLMIRPIFTDLNGDGAIDFLYCGTNVNQSVAYSAFVYNQAPANAGLNFTGATWANFSPALGVNDSPVFIDLTADGKVDMLVGKAIGTFSFYTNTGTNQAPNFQLTNNNWGSITSQYGYSPNLCLGDLNQDGQQDLITGDESGMIRIYYSLQQLSGSVALVADTTIMRDMITGFETQWYLGKHVAPAVANLSGDNLPDVVLGLKGGGLTYLENVLGKPLSIGATIIPSVIKLSLKPVPADDYLDISGIPNGQIRISNTIGQELLSTQLDAEGKLRIDLIGSAWSNGIYIVGQAGQVEKFVVSK